MNENHIYTNPFSYFQETEDYENLESLYFDDITLLHPVINYNYFDDISKFIYN